MIVRLTCGALEGVDAFRVDLEVDYARQGMPAFVMVGLAEGAVREAKERVFAALRASGFRLPPARITVNLAPADRRKAGSAYDPAFEATSDDGEIFLGWYTEDGTLLTDLRATQDLTVTARWESDDAWV